MKNRNTRRLLVMNRPKLLYYCVILFAWFMCINVKASSSDIIWASNGYSLNQEGVLTISIKGEIAGNDDIANHELLNDPDLYYKVKKIIIQSSVTAIGTSAFDDFVYLDTISIPSSVTKIGDNAFYSCGLKNGISIPSSVTSIGKSAFCGCAFTNITIPNKITTIKRNTFTDCYCLKTITIPKSVTSIESGVFDNCEELKDIYYSGSESEWKAISGIKYIPKGINIHYNGGGAGKVTN